MPKPQRQTIVRIQCGLWIDQLQFISAALDQACAGLGAYADPIQTCGCGDGSIGLDCNFEVALVQRCNKRRVDLEQRFSASAHDEALTLVGILRPLIFNGLGQSFRRIELSAARPIHTDKIRVAELADRIGAICFAARPQVAPGKSTEHRGATGLRALALQRVKDFFDSVTHD